MNRKNHKISWLIIAFVCYNIGLFQAQTTNKYCGFPIIQNQLDEIEIQNQINFENNYQRYFSKKTNTKRSASPPYLLPVVYHIIHQNGLENIPDAQILQNLQDLNDAYANIGYYDPSTGADMQIQFCLAKQDPNGLQTSGINRVNSPLTDMILETQDLDVKNLIRWDPTKYINIWVVKEICSNSVGCGVAGYAFFPSSHGSDIDGIVIESKYTGTSQAYSGVLIHEMGHYLGLFHTFQGGCKNDDCLSDGDRVCDTPPDQSIAPVPCGNSVNSCNTDVNLSDSNNPFTVDQNDMYVNYMDYGDPSCYSTFTIGQRERMHFSIENERISLLNSNACNPCPTTIIANFEVDNDIINAGTTINFTNTSIGASQYEWYINGVLFSNAINPSYNFTNEGIFDISLIVKNDDINCKDKFKAVIKVQCPVIASFESSSTSVSPGDIVLFNNTSENANQFQWILDGVVVSTDFNFSQTFSSIGNYDVQLVAFDGICFDTSALTIITVSNTGLAQTGLPVWAVTANKTTIIQSIDWRNEIPEVKTINNEEGESVGQTGVAIDGCGQIAFYAIQTGSGEAKHLNIYAPDGIMILGNPGLNALYGPQEIQIVKVPNHNNEWFIIYSEWTFNPVSVIKPAKILYSRVKLLSKYKLKVLERDVNLMADEENYTYMDGKAISKKTKNNQHFLYGCRRNSYNNVISIDKWVISKDGITYKNNTGDIKLPWNSNYTAAHCPIELSPKEDKIAVTFRDKTPGQVDFLIFNAQKFNNEDFVKIITRDLTLVADGTTSDFSNILPFPSTIKDISLNDNDLNLHFLVNFNKNSSRDIEFSPNGRFLYIISGDLFYDFHQSTYLTYLAQIDLESNPLEVRMQIQTAENYSKITGLGCKLTDCTETWTPISKIQSSYDGNLYFTKTNDNYLYVIPNPNDILPQNLVPSNIDLSTEEEPNIPTQGDVIYMPDQIDGYNYLSTQFQEVEIIVDGEFCDNLCPEYDLEIINNGNIQKTFTITSCPDTLLFCADTNLVYSLSAPDFNIRYDSAIVYAEVNYQPIAPFDFSDFSDCTEICDNGIDDDEDGLIDCDDPDIQDSCCCYVPPILDLGQDTTICDNGIFIFDAGPDFQSYLWWDFSSEQTATAFGAGTYWVEVTDSCGSIQIDTIIINLAEETRLNIGNDTTICLGGSISLSSKGFTEFEWTPPSTLSCTDCETVIATPDTTTRYILVAKNDLDCYSVDTLTVTIIADIDFSVSKEDNSCFESNDGSIHINSDHQSLNFSLDGITFDSNPNFSNLPSGLYNIYIKDSIGCLYSDSIFIIEPDELSLTLSEDREIDLGDTVQIISNSNGQSIEYHWTPNDSLNCSDCENIIVQPFETTTYSLTIIDKNGCAATEKITIFVKSFFDIYIPNAFTPNGDGINDIFYIFADKGVKQVIAMNIYDRWGELVFTNGNFLPNELTNGWDGTLNGKPMDNAIFAYFIEVELLNGRREIIKGDLTLLR